jgi:hypothetical protein
MALIWSPTVETISDEALIARTAAMTYENRKPLQASLLAMLGGLSQHILNDSAARRLPQYVALAFWLRPAALTRLAEDMARYDQPIFVRTPRGVALHLPPTNVDTIFVYSWAMSVLAGNANVVRLPSKLSHDTRWLVETVTHVISEHGESKRHIFCHYDYGGETERALASNADLRMIWGGDAKVHAASLTSIRPDGLSIGFPDRQSIAIISTDAYANASETDRNALAANFFNDVFWFDQMGCGSPRLLVWLKEPHDLADDLYTRLNAEIARRSYGVETGVAISKFGLANDLLAEGLAGRYRHYDNALDINRVNDPAAALCRTHGGGFIHDWVTDALEPIAKIVTRKVQTLTHFGLSPNQVTQLAQRISGRGGYRIVPIGQALQFEPTWDGVNLFEHMTRRIVVR